MGRFERPEFGANVGLIDEIYREYLDNPESVSPAWRDFFAENEPEGYQDPVAREEAPAGAVDSREQPAAESAPKPAPAAAKPATPAPKPASTADANLVPLRGAAARIVEAMEASREVPTATSVRTVPARLVGGNGG